MFGCFASALSSYRKHTIHWAGRELFIKRIPTLCDSRQLTVFGPQTISVILNLTVQVCTQDFAPGKRSNAPKNKYQDMGSKASPLLLRVNAFMHASPVKFSTLEGFDRIHSASPFFSPISRIFHRTPSRKIFNGSFVSFELMHLL